MSLVPPLCSSLGRQRKKAEKEKDKTKESHVVSKNGVLGVRDYVGGSYARRVFVSAGRVDYVPWDRLAVGLHGCQKQKGVQKLLTNASRREDPVADTASATPSSRPTTPWPPLV